MNAPGGMLKTLSLTSKYDFVVAVYKKLLKTLDDDTTNIALQTSIFTACFVSADTALSVHDRVKAKANAHFVDDGEDLVVMPPLFLRARGDFTVMFDEEQHGVVLVTDAYTHAIVPILPREKLHSESQSVMKVVVDLYSLHSADFVTRETAPDTF